MRGCLCVLQPVLAHPPLRASWMLGRSPDHPACTECCVCPRWRQRAVWGRAGTHTGEETRVKRPGRGSHAWLGREGSQAWISSKGNSRSKGTERWEGPQGCRATSRHASLPHPPLARAGRTSPGGHFKQNACPHLHFPSPQHTLRVFYVLYTSAPLCTPKSKSHVALWFAKETC